MKFTITPKVDETQEFIEIANDFSNPLDLVREAISNAYDARATEIEILFDVIRETGENTLQIIVRDNGTGMSKSQLQNFFDLGNSTRTGESSTIGEKGHGTKVYLNSKRIEVKTNSDEGGYHAVMEEPFKKLHNRKIPKVAVIANDDLPAGTEIVILGYNNNRRDKFTQPNLKDYILWSTKHGSFENQFREFSNKVTLKLKGLDVVEPEEIPQGHVFPPDSKNLKDLFEEYLTQAPDYYSKKYIREGALNNFPEIKYEAIFSVEGKNAKYSYNPMLRRSGYAAPKGAYKIQERYGIWLSKDHIPVQKKNDWITYKGSEYLKFHAFVNCQGLKLTANRGSIDNTPSEILQDIEDEVKKVYEEIVSSDEWSQMEWLEDEASAYQTSEKERQHFAWRKKKINRANIASYKDIVLVEPERESGVFTIFMLLSQIDKTLFPFHVIDYDTHNGIDVIAKGDDKTPIVSSKLFYVEFKRTLANGFNHSFENLHSVVCWDTKIKHDEELSDIGGNRRKMTIISPKDKDDYTRYYLDHERSAHKIEVFCLKLYLEEKLSIVFKPRTADAVI